MTVHRKKTLRRWSLRILLFLILVPLGMMVVVRLSGWFGMRKSDREIKAYIGPYQTGSQFDTITHERMPVVFLKTTKGEKKSDAFVFVHGSPGSMDAYLDYIVDSTLLARADMITYDRPGFGASRFGISLPSLYRQAEVVKTLIDSLGYDRYWLVGHSYGAPIIVQTAIRFPSRIEGISLIAGSMSPELEPKARWRKWIDLPLLRDLLPISMRVSNEELMPLKNDLTMIEDDWNTIRASVSIMHGTEDVLVPFENVNYAREKLTNADTVMVKVFDKQSHFILWTHKYEIVQELVAMMKAAEE